MPERLVKVVDQTDNVATLLRDVEAGEVLEIPVDTETVSVEIAENVPFGHKIALADIPAGETVVKYGKSIGNATQPIDAGEWVHVDNVESNYGRGDKASEQSTQTISE